MKPDVRNLLADSVRGLLSSGATGGELLAAAVDGGIREQLVAYPAETIEVLFSAQGRSLVDGSPLLDVVTLDALTRHAPVPLDTDPLTTAILYPTALGGRLVPVCGDGGGLLLGGAHRAESLLAPVLVDGELTIVRFAVPDGLAAVGGLDPRLGLSRPMGLGPITDMVAPRVGGRAWLHAVTAARRALAYELVGLTRAMLERTVEHATQRRQSDRSIGSFQAVRHLLAEVFVAVESAALALEESWDSVDPVQIALAKGLAGAAHAEAAEKCLRVHNTIGFTAQHDLHRYSRRGWVLDLLLGSTREIDEQIGRGLAESGQAERVGHLLER